MRDPLGANLTSASSSSSSDSVSLSYSSGEKTLIEGQKKTKTIKEKDRLKNNQKNKSQFLPLRLPRPGLMTHPPVKKKKKKKKISNCYHNFTFFFIPTHLILS